MALNLHPNHLGVLECQVYLPDNSTLSFRIVEQAHHQTLHGGVGLTMAQVRSQYWIPRLRQLVKKVHTKCHRCKRFQASGYAFPLPGNLPGTRTEGISPYQVIEVHYAGPLRDRVKEKKQEWKAYLLYYRSPTTGVYPDLMQNLETAALLSSLKKFIARPGRSERLYSDKGWTFVGAAK